MNDKLCDSNGIQTIPLPDNSQGGKKMGGELYQVAKYIGGELSGMAKMMGGKLSGRGIVQELTVECGLTWSLGKKQTSHSTRHGSIPPSTNRAPSRAVTHTHTPDTH